MRIRSRRWAADCDNTLEVIGDQAPLHLLQFDCDKSLIYIARDPRLEQGEIRKRLKWTARRSGCFENSGRGEVKIGTVGDDVSDLQRLMINRKPGMLLDFIYDNCHILLRVRTSHRRCSGL